MQGQLHRFRSGRPANLNLYGHSSSMSSSSHSPAAPEAPAASSASTAGCSVAQYWSGTSSSSSSSSSPESIPSLSSSTMCGWVAPWVAPSVVVVVDTSAAAVLRPPRRPVPVRFLVDLDLGTADVPGAVVAIGELVEPADRFLGRRAAAEGDMVESSRSRHPVHCAAGSLGSAKSRMGRKKLQPKQIRSTLPVAIDGLDIGVCRCCTFKAGRGRAAAAATAPLLCPPAGADAGRPSTTVPCNRLPVAGPPVGPHSATAAAAAAAALAAEGSSLTNPSKTSQCSGPVLSLPVRYDSRTRTKMTMGAPLASGESTRPSNHPSSSACLGTLAYTVTGHPVPSFSGTVALEMGACPDSKERLGAVMSKSFGVLHQQHMPSDLSVSFVVASLLSGKGQGTDRVSCGTPCPQRRHPNDADATLQQNDSISTTVAVVVPLDGVATSALALVALGSDVESK
eukprot:m.197961 g.197961  ORF g.197961 m.197961 type:complete len:453 (-) comp20283_c0_seq1:1105-2463(-)